MVTIDNTFCGRIIIIIIIQVGGNSFIASVTLLYFCELRYAVLFHCLFFVSSFYLNNTTVWGVDRLFIVERMLGNKSAAPERLSTPPKVSMPDLISYQNNIINRLIVTM